MLGLVSLERRDQSPCFLHHEKVAICKSGRESSWGNQIDRHFDFGFLSLWHCEKSVSVVYVIQSILFLLRQPEQTKTEANQLEIH
jgi:hypothetical protein